MNDQDTMLTPVPMQVGSKPKTYQAGRVCTHEECDTVLSKYNKSDLCFLHQPVKRPRLRGRMPSEIMEDSTKVKKCRSCGQRIRRGAVLGEPIEVLIDGVRHIEGTDGSGTLCEDRS